MGWARVVRAARHRVGAYRRLGGAVLLAGTVLLAGCTGESTPPAAPPSSTPTHEPVDARDQLAALAAAAQDRHLVVVYTLRTEGRPDRAVTVTLAGDGSWRVDIPGGVLGGDGDVSIAENASGRYQCSLPSPYYPEPPTCVRVSGPGQPLPAEIDPRLQHLFTDWPEVLTDRRAPLAVSAARLAGAQGSCFSVESTATSVAPPMDAGIYCYAPDGTLTAARLPAGTLALAGTPTAAPATIALPGPVVQREPLPVAAPHSDAEPN